MKDLRKLYGWLALLITVITVFGPMKQQAAVAQTAQTENEETLPYCDVDGDGRANMMDCIRLYSYTAGRSALSEEELGRSDVTGDGEVTTYDALWLYRTVSGENVTTAPTSSESVPATTATTAVLGVDVSYAQSTISWQAVKDSEVSFAILRCGYGDDEPGQQDTQWEKNAAACEALNIPYGAYFFCYARNAEEAAREAQHALRLLQGKHLTLPVFLDMEYSSWQGTLTPETYAEIATVFCETVGAAGYKVGVYSNLDWWNNRLTDPCFDRWYRWVAQYNEECEYRGEYHLWQYSDKGSVSGISGKVDMNYCYVNLDDFLS